jgi:Heterokaryon incompatibility protein (HET)
MASARGPSSCHSQAYVISLQKSSSLLTFTGPGPSTSNDPFTAKRLGGNVDQGINWLTQCLAEHPACVPKLDIKEPPRRLIFVGSGDVDAVPRLVETTTYHKDLRYMTLSHCWGKQPIFTLTTDNYATMLQRIPLSHLQQVFRDAISMTQKAEIDYLWIDSLCIIQDSVEDWKHESMNMGMVYSGAVCNIAATGFPDGSNGLFIEAEAPLNEPVEIQLNADVTAHDGECFRKGDYRLVDFLSWSNDVDNAPLNKRGWVVQERFLSPRIMHFGAKQLYWECRTLEASEAFPHGLPQEVFTGKVKKSVHMDPRRPKSVESVDRWDFNKWANAVTAYSRSRLTFDSDKMIAIAGLAKSLQHPFLGSYLGGMWSNFLLSHLTWSAVPFELRPRPDKYRCPSWSWASIDTGVNIPLVPVGQNLRRHFIASVCETQTTPLDLDHFGTLRGGWIRILCPMLCIRLVELEEPTVLTIPSADAIPITFSTISIQMDVQDDHSDEYAKAITTPMAVKVVNFADNPTPRPLEDVCDYLTPIEKREGDISAVTGVRLKGLVLRATTQHRGEFQRIGMFDSESLDVIELLQKSSQNLPTGLYENRADDGRYQISVI